MFGSICTALALGEMTAPPRQLSGGYLHRMFRLQTDRGVYAVKLLNPEIMQRPEVLDNYASAEAGEKLLEDAALPILPALTIGGHKLQRVDEQYLYVFAYFDGHALPVDEIMPAHCQRIGAVLARIHALDRRACDAAPDAPPIDWLMLAGDLLSCAETREEGKLLQSAAPMLVRTAAAAQEAARRLPKEEALCHNDMDPKNVLWQGDDFRIIDLECVGYANPAQEMLDLALSWSGGREDRFKAFVSAYAGAGGLLPDNADDVYDSRRNYIDWLAYNARRALGKDPQEQAIARQQIRWTLDKIRGDLAMREQVLTWLQEAAGRVLA